MNTTKFNYRQANKIINALVKKTGLTKTEYDAEEEKEIKEIK